MAAATGACEEEQMMLKLAMEASIEEAQALRAERLRRRRVAEEGAADAGAADAVAEHGLLVGAVVA